jgi:hypothetical protein
VTPSLCVSPHCRARGYHHPDCQDADCAGCTPRLAADGVRLCPLHVRRIGEDAVKAAGLHDEIALRLTGAGQAGERTSGTPDHGTDLDPRAVEVRATIRHTLVSWCHLIAEERGHALPADTLPALGGYVARHAEWLAATEYAGEVSDELHALVSAAWPVAYPSGARVFPVGPCPHDGCTGTLKAILRPRDTLFLPAELQCDADDAHSYPSSEWVALGRKLRPKHTEGTAA